MELHRNAKLGLSGRFALVQARANGMPIREVARRFSVSPATVSRWSCRWQAASGQERASLACLFDRSSRPRRMPRLLAAREQQRICAARKQTGWGPRMLTMRTGHSHSTIWKVLHRHGLSRPARAPREPARRYEWPCPGDLLHTDWTQYARFERPGHAVTGERRRTAAEKRARVGYDFAHALVDDHSRLGYAELLPDCRAATVTGFLERALAVFAARGIEARRLMTDNHWSYTRNRSLRELLAERSIRHLNNAEAAAAGQRQGRALPPDDGPRVGLRPPLPLLPTPRRRPATLAALLQRTQTPQLPRRTTAPQPRSQRLWAGQLAVRGRGVLPEPDHPDRDQERVDKHGQRHREEHDEGEPDHVRRSTG